jgi:hypothetical protein
MDNWWMFLLIAVLATVIGSLFRGQRGQGRPSWRPFDIPEDQSPQPEVLTPPRRSAPLPARRRVQPPPLPRGTRREVLEAIPVAVPAPHPAVAQPGPLDLPIVPVVDKRPRPAALRELFALLKDRRTLRSAVMLREVFAPPLCKRRR